MEMCRHTIGRDGCSEHQAVARHEGTGVAIVDPDSEPLQGIPSNFEFLVGTQLADWNPHFDHRRCSNFFQVALFRDSKLMPDPSCDALNVFTSSHQVMAGTTGKLPMIKAEIQFSCAALQWFLHGLNSVLNHVKTHPRSPA